MDKQIKEQLKDWPDCAREGCQNKVCTWGSNELCYPHEEELVGKDEMDKRYNMTHEHPIGQVSTRSSNYMTKTFKDLQLEAGAKWAKNGFMNLNGLTES